MQALLASCDLFIGNDSGPTQIAAAVGTPVIAIFLSTSTIHLGNNFVNRIVKLYPRIACAPCYKKRCPSRYECRQDISVDIVMEEAVKLLEDQ